MFKLKNYTTGIKAEKSIFEIEQLLSQFGANAVMKEFASDGTVRSLSFKLSGKSYRLPSNVEGVYNVMFEGKRLGYRPNALKNRQAQAHNTSWRILRDWIHAQLSVIASGQAQPEEIMLPFMFDGKRTLYEAFKSGTKFGNLQIDGKGDEND